MVSHRSTTGWTRRPINNAEPLCAGHRAQNAFACQQRGAREETTRQQRAKGNVAPQKSRATASRPRRPRGRQQPKAERVFVGAGLRASVRRRDLGAGPRAVCDDARGQAVWREHARPTTARPKPYPTHLTRRNATPHRLQCVDQRLMDLRPRKLRQTYRISLKSARSCPLDRRMSRSPRCVPYHRVGLPPIGMTPPPRQRMAVDHVAPRGRSNSPKSSSSDFRALQAPHR